MVSFHGGPANGLTLMLRRAPAYLRVVVTRYGKPVIDALDQLDDRPKGAEDIYVYRLRGKARGSVHICARGKGAQSGWTQIADYDHVLDGVPDDRVLRQTEGWRAWVLGRMEREKQAAAVAEEPTR